MNGEVTEYITLRYTQSRMFSLARIWNCREYRLIDSADSFVPRPCTEANIATYYQGKTFSAIHFINGVRQEFIGIILCPEQYQADWRDEKERQPIVPTLAQGFTVTGYPTPPRYNSVAGSLLHEMVHVVGRSRDRTCKWWMGEGITLRCGQMLTHWQGMIRLGGFPVAST